MKLTIGSKQIALTIDTRIRIEKSSHLNYIFENWPSLYTDAIASPSMEDKLKEWDAANTTDNGKYVVAPFWVDVYNVNGQNWGSPGSTFIDNSNSGSMPDWEIGAFRGYGIYCLQFRV